MRLDIIDGFRLLSCRDLLVLPLALDWDGPSGTTLTKQMYALAAKTSSRLASRTVVLTSAQCSTINHRHDPLGAVTPHPSISLWHIMWPGCVGVYA